MKLYYVYLVVFLLLLSREARLWQALAIDRQRADAQTTAVALEIAKAIPRPAATPAEQPQRFHRL